LLIVIDVLFLFDSTNFVGVVVTVTATIFYHLTI